MAGGRPSKYHTHVEPKLLLIAAWCRNGLTDKDIAEKLGVSVDSMVEYKKQFPELSDTLRQNKEVIDTQVENALLKAALGYEYEEVVESSTSITRTTKYAAPNTTALIFWLKNRNPVAWRDKQDIEHSGTVTQDIKHDLKKLSPEELRSLEHILTKTTDTG